MPSRETRDALLESIRGEARAIAHAELEASDHRGTRDSLFLKAQKAGATREQIADAAKVSVAAVKYVLGRAGAKRRRAS